VTRGKDKPPRENGKTKDAHLKGGRYEGSDCSQISAFLIDIWRLEMAASHSKQTMGVRSNRHCCDTPRAAIFGDGNASEMPEIGPRGGILPPFARRAKTRPPEMRGGRYEGNGTGSGLKLRRYRKQNRPPEMRGGRYKGKGDGSEDEKFEVMT
jgi:hypothetical protein